MGGISTFERFAAGARRVAEAAARVKAGEKAAEEATHTAELAKDLAGGAKEAKTATKTVETAGKASKTGTEAGVKAADRAPTDEDGHPSTVARPRARDSVDVWTSDPRSC